MEELRKLQPGRRLKYPTYIPTTIARDEAQVFASATGLLETTVLAGANTLPPGKLVALYAHEAEIILSRSSTLRIFDKVLEGDLTIYRCTLEL